MFQQSFLCFARAKSKCILRLVCAYLGRIVRQMGRICFYPSLSQYAFRGIDAVKRVPYYLPQKLPEHGASTVNGGTPSRLFSFLSFFVPPPQGQYEIIRQPSVLTSVWIYSWCSLEMPGNKSLLSHRHRGPCPCSFLDSSRGGRERRGRGEERQGRENERTRCPRRWN